MSCLLNISRLFHLNQKSQNLVLKLNQSHFHFKRLRYLNYNDRFSKLSTNKQNLNNQFLDLGVLAATSILHQRANEIRNQRINWQSYLQSLMISEDDFKIIVSLDTSSPEQREAFLKENRLGSAKTLFNLLEHISKDQTIQYILIMIDDLLNEEKSRVELFKEYCKKKKQSVWNQFLQLLNRNDGFIQNMVMI